MPKESEVLRASKMGAIAYVARKSYEIGLNNNSMKFNPLRGAEISLNY